MSAPNFSIPGLMDIDRPVLDASGMRRCLDLVSIVGEPFLQTIALAEGDESFEAEMWVEADNKREDLLEAAVAGGVLTLTIDDAKLTDLPQRHWYYAIHRTGANALRRWRFGEIHFAAP